MYTPMIPIVLKITPEKNEIAINTPVVPKTALPKYLSTKAVGAKY